MDIITKIKNIEIPYFEKHIKINIYDYENYNIEEEKDLISFCLEKYKCWKPYQSELIREILKGGDYLCVDVGSHLGIHSIISSIYGNRTISIDSNKNVNNIFRKTIEDNNLQNIKVLDMKITNKTKIDEITNETKIRLLKVNVRSCEQQIVYDVFKEFFKEKQIDYALFEITTNYKMYKFVEELHNLGYKVINIGLSPQREIIQTTGHLYSGELDKKRITKKFDKRMKLLDGTHSDFLFISDKAFDKCDCDCDIGENYFKK